MIDKLRNAKPWQRLLAAIVSFVISTVVLTLLLGDPLGAIIVMACITLHELCHLLAYRYYGIKAGILFFAIFALTYGIADEDVRWDKPSQTLWVLTAGVAGNCLIGFIALGLSFLVATELATILLIVIAQINFLLALLNLAPGFGTDGERISKLISHFLRDDWGKDARFILIVADIVGMLGTQIMMGLLKVPSFLGILITLLFGFDLFAKGITKKAKEEEETDIGELTKKEALIHAAVYLALILLALFGLWFIPLPVI